MGKSIKDILIDIKSTNFVINWASGAILLGAITWATTATIQNKSLKTTVGGLKEQVSTLKENNHTLTEAVKSLQGSNDVVKNVIQEFVKNPPAILNNKLEDLSKKIDRYHGHSPNNNPDDFNNRPPSD